MRRWTWFLALCLAATAASAGDTLRLSVSGAITVAPDGTVRNQVLANGLPPAVESLVSGAIAKWEFEPVVRNGVPSHTRSLVHMTLLATEVSGGYQLRVEDVRFSGYRQPASRESPHASHWAWGSKRWSWWRSGSMPMARYSTPRRCRRS